MSEDTYDTDPLIRTLVEQLAQAQGLPLFRQKSYRLLEAFARQREAAALEEAADLVQDKLGAFMFTHRHIPVSDTLAAIRARAQQRRGATEQEGGGAADV